MAYYLEFDGQNDRVDIGSEIFVSGDGFLFEIDFVYKGTAFDHLVGGSNLIFRINNTASLNLRVDGSSQNLNFNNSLVAGERYYFKLGRTGGAYQIFNENDEPISNSRNLPDSPIGISKIGAQFTNANNIPMDFYGLKVNQSGVLIHNYDPSASSGTGQLIDTEGGNHGTPVNFSDFEAALIYYDDGGGGGEPQEPPAVTGGSDVDGLSIAGVATSDVNAPSVTGGSDVDGLAAGGSVASESGPPAVFGLFDVDGLSIAGVATSDVNAPGVIGGSDVDGLSVSGLFAGISLDFGISPVNRLDVRQRSNIIYIKHKEGF